MSEALHYKFGPESIRKSPGFVGLAHQIRIKFKFGPHARFAGPLMKLQFSMFDHISIS